jgi:predicted nucleotidyltransferase
MISACESSLAVTPAKVEAAVKRLVEVGRPRKIILFGSYVRGTRHEDSDLDILVVTGDEVTEPHKESARLRRALDDILMAMDILVVPESIFRQLRNQPGLIYREACEQGKVVYECAG